MANDIVEDITVICVYMELVAKRSRIDGSNNVLVKKRNDDLKRARKFLLSLESF